MSSKCWQWIIAGRLEPQFVAEHLAIDERQLARVLGTGVVVLRDVREEADIEARKRLHSLARILHCVEPWTGSTGEAFSWYTSERLPSFGGRTAAQLVREGRASAVIDYLARIDQGGYA